MITFWLDNGVVITLRTSGTEPKIKVTRIITTQCTREWFSHKTFQYYTEYCAAPDNKDWAGVEEELGNIVASVVEELFQPSLNGLIPKPV